MRRKGALDAAASEASSSRKHAIGTDHLLLGLLRVDDGPAATLLASHAEEIRRQIDQLSPAPDSGTANEIADAVAAAADETAKAAQLAANRDWYEQAAEIRDAERRLRDLLRRLLPLLVAPPAD